MRRKFTCYRCGKYVEAEMDDDGVATCPSCENVIELEPERKLQNRIASLESQLAEARARLAWIPVSEPPKVDGEYLVFDTYKQVYSALYRRNEWSPTIYDAIVTHWMPLPSAPEEAA